MHDLPTERWEQYAWSPDQDPNPEGHFHARSARTLNTKSQRAHRLNTVESVFVDDVETIDEWKRRQHRA